MEIKIKDQSLLKFQAFINGGWCNADSGKTIDVTNPATGELIGTVPKCGADETRRAIEAANKALPAWRAKTAQERSAVVRKWGELMMANQEDLAVIMTSEQGKPLPEAKGEIAYAAAFLEWFAEEGKRVYGDIIPNTIPTQRIVVIKQPVGVVASITPWNFPAAMITRKAGPALAVGCTMIAKPASATPLSALALAELGIRAGIPAGVFNVVPGSAGAVAGELTANPIVRKLTFTGSTEVGKKLMADCAGTMKKISMELGGNAPFIVFNDADVDAAVQGAIISKYRNTGQTCVCTNRFLVQSGIYDAFCAKLAEAVNKMVVGNGLENGVSQGPLIDANAFEKVKMFVSDALDKGGKLVTGGKPHSLGGTFFEPTIIAEASNAMLLAKDEIFGPLAPIFRFETEEEAIKMANDTEYGLAAYFYTRDMARTWRVGEGLEYGIVGVNTGLISNATAPFGGVKESGLGREGSKYGVDDYLEIKYICMDGVA